MTRKFKSHFTPIHLVDETYIGAPYVKRICTPRTANATMRNSTRDRSKVTCVKCLTLTEPVKEEKPK